MSEASVPSKDAARQRIWQLLNDEGAGRGDVRGHIPDFVGSEQAADRLTELDGWQAARTIKINPDTAQQPVRVNALQAAKLVFMAVPRLALPDPFYRLDPVELGDDAVRAADRAAAADLAPTTGLEDMPPIDLVVCGSVGVNYEGVRIGKGAGYSDIEVALLAEAGLLRPETVIVTTVHELQVVDEQLPHEPHDFTVDYIVTPERVISCANPHRPAGIDRQLVTTEMRETMPVLSRSRPL